MGVICVPRISIGSVRDALEDEFRQPSGRVVPRGLVEGVVIGLADPALDALVAVDRQVVPQVVGKDPQVVETEEVVGVLVGIDHGVDQPDLLAKQLHAQIGGGVDEQVPARKAEHDTAPSSLVLGIPAQAGRAAAPITGTPCEVPVPRKIS